jgi:hypothetical protein
MVKKKLIWFSKFKILQNVNLTADAMDIINDLYKIKKYFCKSNMSKTQRTILIKLTLAICGHKVGYKVYGNQMYHKSKNSPQNGTAKAYSVAYKIVLKLFKWDAKRIRKEFHANKEWLYDFHWYLEEGEKKGVENFILKRDDISHLHYCPISFPLVVECEFGNSNSKNRIYRQVRYDFQKLLIANAELRLMVFRKNLLQDKKKKDGRFEFLSEYFVNAINFCEFLPDKSKFLFAVFDEKKNNLKFSYYEKGT